jgi:hypothetical protein
MMPAPPRGERPWRLPTLASAAVPPGQTDALSLSRRNSRATYAPAPAVFQARESQRASHRAAFGMPGRAGKARSAAVVGPHPLSPRRAGAVARRHPWPTSAGVVTAVEPQAQLQQAQLRQACVRAAPHVADGAWRADAGGVAFPGFQWRGFGCLGLDFFQAISAVGSERPNAPPRLSKSALRRDMSLLIASVSSPASLSSRT